MTAPELRLNDTSPEILWTIFEAAACMPHYYPKPEPEEMMVYMIMAIDETLEMLDEDDWRRGATEEEAEKAERFMNLRQVLKEECLRRMGTGWLMMSEDDPVLENRRMRMFRLITEKRK